MNLNTVFLSNSSEEYFRALFLAILVFTILRSVKRAALSFFRKQRDTKGRDIDRALYEMVSCVRTWFAAIVALYVGSELLELTPQFATLTEWIFMIALVVQMGILSSTFTRFFLLFLFAKGKSATTQSALEIIGNLVSIPLWVLGFLFILSIFGVEITSLIAFLGIVGLTVTLALHGVLSDLSSLLANLF